MTTFVQKLLPDVYERLDAFSIRAFALFSTTQLAFTVVFSGAIVATGVLDCIKCLRAGRWRMPLLWIIYVPFLFGILSWKITGNPSWQATAIIGIAILAAYRLSLRFCEWYAS